MTQKHQSEFHDAHEKKQKIYVKTWFWYTVEKNFFPSFQPLQVSSGPWAVLAVKQAPSDDKCYFQTAWLKLSSADDADPLCWL